MIRLRRRHHARTPGKVEDFMKRLLVPPQIPAVDLIPLLAHDLRTPVTAIKGFGQLLLRQPDLSSRVDEYGSTVVAEADYIASLIDDLVLLTHAERGDREVQCVEFDLGTLVARAIDQPLTVRSPARFEMEVEPTGLTVTADPFLTERAIVNVIRVALKHCRRTDIGQLRVCSGPNGPSIWIATPLRGLTRESVRPEPIGAESPEGAKNGLGFRDLTLYLGVRLIDLVGGQFWEGEVAEDSARFLIAFPRDSEATRKSGGG